MQQKVDLGDVLNIPDEPTYAALHAGVECHFNSEFDLLTGWQRTPIAHEQVRLRWLNIKSADRTEEIVSAFTRLSPRLPEVQAWAAANLQVSDPEPVESVLEALEEYRFPLTSSVAHALGQEDVIKLLLDQASGTYRYKLGGVEPLALVKSQLPATFFREQALSTEPGMRRLVAASSATPPNIINTLLSDSNPSVAAAARANPLSEADPQHLLADYHRQIAREGFIDFYDLHESAFVTLLNHPQFPFEAILGRPVPDEQKLLLLAQSDLPPLRLYVASLPDTPTNVKLELAHRAAETGPAGAGEDQAVKEKLAWRSKDRSEVLHALMRDPSPSVRRLAASRYLEHLLRQQDPLTPYGWIPWNRDIDLDNWRYDLMSVFPALGDIRTRGITLHFKSRSTGFRVDHVGNAVIYQDTEYRGHSAEDPEQNEFYLLEQDYDSEGFGALMVRTLAQRGRGFGQVTFPLREAFVTDELAASATQFDQRLVAALAARQQLVQAVELWLNEFVLNFDAWWATLRPLRVLNQYAPHVREAFEQALLASGKYLECVGYGLKHGFGHGWDDLPVTRAELLEARNLAQRAGHAEVIAGLDALLATMDGDTLPESQPDDNED